MTLDIGQTTALWRRFSADDRAAYAVLFAGAPATVPVALVDGLISSLLGTVLPGPGTNYLKQYSELITPLQWGDVAIARITVTRLRPDKRLADFATTVRHRDGRPISTGRALVKYAHPLAV